MRSTLRKAKNKKRKETGITLIALIITIIVLLILAGITIGMLTSNNSILKQAGSARNETRKSEEAEKVNLAIMDAATNASTTVSGELTTEFVKNAIKGQFGEDAVSKVKGSGPWIYTGEYDTYEISKAGKVSEANATIAKDSNNEEYSIPRGATHIEDTTVDSGLVISYKGSEFVWIPVNDNLEVMGKNGVSTGKKMAKLSTGTYEGKDDKGRAKYEGVLYDSNLNEMESSSYGQNTTSRKEPAELQGVAGGDWSPTANRGFSLLIRHIDEYKGLANNTENQAIIKTKWVKQLQEEYDAMIESVKKYGGFYVGRYETSEDISSVANANPISAGTIKDGYAQTWYGLYQRQKNFTTRTDSMVASMIWGSQWDAMLNWAKASGTESADFVTQTGHANHNYSTAQKTGTETRDVINNIYDLEGNMYEWTLEASDKETRTKRGGFYRSDGNFAPSYRDNYYPFHTATVGGSRLSLYIR